MPADDIVTKTIPAIGVVVIAGQAPGFGAANIVPVVNQLAAQFDQLRIHDRVKEAGPRIVFYEREHGEDVTVCLALPVAGPPDELPAPAHYRVLPQIEARRRESFRWCTTIWSGGSRSRATTLSPARAAKCGYTK